jgi:hypothetical protein
MSGKMTFLATLLVLVASASAAQAESTVTARIARDNGGQPECSGPIGEFFAAIDSDVETGNLDRSVYTRIVAALRTIKSTCVSGNAQDALRQLGAVKHRYGYR